MSNFSYSYEYSAIDRVSGVVRNITNNIKKLDRAAARSKRVLQSTLSPHGYSKQALSARASMGKLGMGINVSGISQSFRKISIQLTRLILLAKTARKAFLDLGVGGTIGAGSRFKGGGGVAMAPPLMPRGGLARGGGDGALNLLHSIRSGFYTSMLVGGMAAALPFMTIKTSAMYEKQMVDVARTTNATREQMESLKKDFLDIKYASFSEIGAAAKEAGKAGIGADSIGSVTDLVIKASNALDLNAAETMENLGKILGRLQISKTPEIVKREATRWADMVASLENNLAIVKAPDLFSMLQDITVTADLMKFTPEETAGMGARFLQRFRSPQKAAMAFNMVYEGVARNAKRMPHLWETIKGGGATGFMKVINFLSKFDNRQLSEMKFDARVIRSVAFVGAKGAVKGMKAAIDIARKAMGTVEREVFLFQKSLEGHFKRAGKSFSDLLDAIGTIATPATKTVLSGASAAADFISSIIRSSPKITSAMFSGVAGFFSSLGVIFMGKATMWIGRGIKFVVSNLFKASPWVRGILLIGTLLGFIYEFIKNKWGSGKMSAKEAVARIEATAPSLYEVQRGLAAQKYFGVDPRKFDWATASAKERAAEEKYNIEVYKKHYDAARRGEFLRLTNERAIYDGMGAKFITEKLRRGNFGIENFDIIIRKYRESILGKANAITLRSHGLVDFHDKAIRDLEKKYPFLIDSPYRRKKYTQEDVYAFRKKYDYRTLLPMKGEEVISKEAYDDLKKGIQTSSRN